VELKPGYKQTEVGMIPEDWGSTTVTGIASSVRNAIVGGPFGSDLVSTDYVEDGVPVIRGQNMGQKRLSGEFVFVSHAKAISLESNLARYNDLVFTQRGTLGQVSLVPKSTFDRYLVSQSQMKLTVNQRVANPEFYYYVFSSSEQQEYIRKNTIQTGVPHINLGILRHVPISCPSLLEQEAIAQALSDADALIESLEQLIAKKRQVKQGAMQELLRPTKSWKPVTLGEVADPNQKWSFTGGPFGSNLKSSDYTDDGVRIIQLQNIGDGDFKNNYQIFTSLEKANELLSCNIYPGEIILSKMGDPVARACIIPPLHTRYLMCSDGIRLAVDQKRFDTFFIYTIVNAPDFRIKAENAGTGSTRKRIGLTELRNLELLSPTLPEQTAIASILSDMDTEIVTLETKLEKARQVKQGMMHNLLTGRIRLV
jgi:type I restriction enzyme, S subunit